MLCLDPGDHGPSGLSRACWSQLAIWCPAAGCGVDPGSSPALPIDEQDRLAYKNVLVSARGCTGMAPVRCSDLTAEPDQQSKIWLAPSMHWVTCRVAAGGSAGPYSRIWQPGGKTWLAAACFGHGTGVHSLQQCWPLTCITADEEHHIRVDRRFVVVRDSHAHSHEVPEVLDGHLVLQQVAEGAGV